MKYIRLRAWLTILFIVVGVILLLNYSTGSSGPYKSSAPVTDSLITADYPKLYDVIAERSGPKLKPFLTHQHDELKAQSWRALAHTPIDSGMLSSLLSLVQEQNTAPAWFAISKKALSNDQLRLLEQWWKDNKKMRAGIARVLGKQGDEESLQFLLDQSGDIEPEYEYQYALAIGRLVQQFDLENDLQIKVIQKAFDTGNYRATRAYLYGWYRGDESRLTATAQDSLFNRWQLMGTGISRDVDQYVNKILPARTTYTMTVFYNGEQMLDSQVQLAYELASSVGNIPLNDKNALAAKILLTNENPHVQKRILQSLSKRIESEQDLKSYLREEMLTDDSLSDEAWLQALQVMIGINDRIIADHQKRLKAIPEKNPYLWPDVLTAYRKGETTESYINRVDQLIQKGETLPVMYALQDLNTFLEKNDQAAANYFDKLREIVFEALAIEDRGIHYMVAPLLEEKQLFSGDDFEQINSTLSSFSLPGDIEVYQAFGDVYQKRFQEQAQPVIDSWAAENYGPLNRSLVNMGWAVEVPEEVQTEFRMPNWKRLWELGRKPVMRIVTDKGRVDIQLNTLSAPATVSMLDSLSRAGAYNGVPFHRVVPNFVIQGGDIERQDGFGGPDFVIPTEATEKEFNRSAVGIASAGPDTEGSQYFVMHQWMPHLNGNYTRFGEVINGMDVVDRITVGDKVRSITWITAEQADSVL